MYGEPENERAGDEIRQLERLAEVLGELRIGDSDRDALRRDVVHVISGYLVPRLRNPDGPLVVAIAGPDGVGKSHVVNALVGSAYSPEGAVRPTTTAPLVLVGRKEAGTFGDLERRLHTATPAISVRQDDGPVTDGVVIIDLPPIPGATSIERILDLSDMVIVVVSPERYADETVWSLIRRLGATGSPMLMVVNKVLGPHDEVIADFAGRLESEAVDAPVFPVEDRRREAASDTGVADVRSHLQEMRSSGRTRVIEAVHRRAEWATSTAAGWCDPLDSLGHRIGELRAIADARYSKAAEGARGLVSPAGLGPGAAETPWSVLSDRLAGVLTRRVGMAAAHTAAEWSRTEHGQALLSGGGSDLWRHPAQAAAQAGSQLQAWESDVAGIVEDHMRRRSSRARDVTAVVMRIALGSGEKPRWRIRRRLRTDIDEVARGAATQLSDIAARIVVEDEQRFLERLGSGPDSELVAELRSLTKGRSSAAASGLPPVPESPDA